MLEYVIIALGKCMKITDVFQPRKVVIQNNKDSLPTFYAKVQSVLATQKIFVSQEIFAETWKLCQSHNGRVEVLPGTENKVVYAFRFKDKQQSLQKYMFCVFCDAKPHKKIQLVGLNTGKVSYKYVPQKYSDSFYLTRPLQKNLEKE